MVIYATPSAGCICVHAVSYNRQCSITCTSQSRMEHACAQWLLLLVRHTNTNYAGQGSRFIQLPRIQAKCGVVESSEDRVAFPSRYFASLSAKFCKIDRILRTPRNFTNRDRCLDEFTWLTKVCRHFYEYIVRAKNHKSHVNWSFENSNLIMLFVTIMRFKF